MQSDPWGGIEPEHKSEESKMRISDSVIQGDVTHIANNFNDQIIMLQPPSSSSKVIGILLIIYGVLNLFSLLFSLIAFTSSEINDEMGYSSVEVILLVMSGFVATLTSIIGGYWMSNYQRKGIHLALVGLVVGFLIQIIMSFSESTQDSYEQLGLEGPTVTALVVGIQSACMAVCGLIIAIPLMVDNNGLDDSKLF